MTKRVLVPVSAGFEEIEALAVVDVLRRAGAEVVLAGLGSAPTVTGRSSITVIPDASLDEAVGRGSYDAVVLPGGLPNAHTLRDDARVIDLVRGTHAGGGVVAAICAAPVALARAGLLDGVPATCHPSKAAELRAVCRFSEERVVVAGRVVTSRAAGTAVEFAFALVRLLFGDAKVAEVNQGVLARLD